MSRNKWIALGVGLLVAAAVGWYFASPWYTLRQMKSAAEASNSEALSTYIDFPALREDLKADLLASMMAEVPKDNSPFSGFAMALAPAIVGGMVDGFVTPAGLKAMFVSKSKEAKAAKAPGNDAPKPGAEALQMKEDPIIKRRGFSEFLVTSKDEPNSGMVFKRHGLGWKLSGVELPPTPAKAK
jgi:hypothetical protein